MIEFDSPDCILNSHWIHDIIFKMTSMIFWFNHISLKETGTPDLGELHPFYNFEISKQYHTLFTLHYRKSIYPINYAQRNT